MALSKTLSDIDLLFYNRKFHNSSIGSRMYSVRLMKEKNSIIIFNSVVGQAEIIFKVRNTEKNNYRTSIKMFVIGRSLAGLLTSLT